MKNSLRQSHASQRRAFTLVEVTATIVVLAVVASVASRTIVTATNGYINAAVQAQLHTELSVTLDRIVREIRKIDIKTEYESVAPNIISVTANSIAWGDGSALTLSGNQIMFADEGATAAVILEDVTAFTIQTYNESNVLLGSTLNGTACDPIRRIVVQITLQRSGITETLRTKIYLRGTMEGAQP